MNGGPTQMDHAAAQTRWQGHPWLARLLRAAIALLPITLSVTFSLLAARFPPPHRLGMNRWLWRLAVGTTSTVLLVVVDRVASQLRIVLRAENHSVLVALSDDRPSSLQLVV